MKTQSLSASASALSASLETRHSMICKGSGLGLTCVSRHTCTHVVVVFFCSGSQIHRFASAVTCYPMMVRDFGGKQFHC